MALEDIFKALEQQAERDITDVLAEARARAAALVAEAEIEAQRIRERHVADAESAANSRAAQSRNSARLEARRLLAGVRQKAVSEAFEKAKLAMEDLRSSEGYGELFERLLGEALDGVSGEFDVLVDKRDGTLARASLSSRGLDQDAASDLTTAGGVIISMKEGRILRKNTLESRFEKFVDNAHADVAEILFS